MTNIEDESIPLKGIRKKMYDRMSYIAQTYASVTTAQKADVTNLIEMKRKLTQEWEPQTGIKPRYIVFFIKAAGKALIEYPIINSTIDKEESLILLRKEINIGIAMNTEKGLIVPVLPHVQELSLSEIAEKINDLISRALSKKLTPVDFQNGTFTITNAGTLGAYFNTPMINPPQSAVLSTCSINEEPAVFNGAIVPRKQMFLTLTYDHRIIEGAEAVGFINRVREFLEKPHLLHT